MTVPAATPFRYDAPVDPDRLIDREAELAELAEVLAAGRNVRLVAPRRYGKTSLIRRLARDLDGAGLTCVLVDLAGVLTVVDVAVRIDRAYGQALRGPLRRWWDGVARTLRPAAGVGVGPARASMSASSVEAEGDRAMLLDRLALPVRVAERTGRRVLVVLDEFQDLLTAGDQLDAVLRSEIQHHADQVAYLFSGSRPGMMRELFAGPERPLYGQAHPVELGPLPPDAAIEELGAAFAAAERDVDAVLGTMIDLAEGHPQRAMMLAAHLWAETPEGAVADEETLERAIGAVEATLEEAFQARWDHLPSGEQRALAAIAYEQGVYGRDARRAQGLAHSTAQRATGSLADRGEIVKAEARPSGWRIVDPLFGRWIRRWRADLLETPSGMPDGGT